MSARSRKIDDHVAEMFGTSAPDWVLAEYYANGPQPYILRLMKTFSDFKRKKMANEELDSQS